MALSQTDKDECRRTEFRSVTAEEEAEGVLTEDNACWGEGCQNILSNYNLFVYQGEPIAVYRKGYYVDEHDEYFKDAKDAKAEKWRYDFGNFEVCDTEKNTPAYEELFKGPNRIVSRICADVNHDDARNPYGKNILGVIQANGISSDSANTYFNKFFLVDNEKGISVARNWRINVEGQGFYSVDEETRALKSSKAETNPKDLKLNCKHDPNDLYVICEQG